MLPKFGVGNHFNTYHLHVPRALRKLIFEFGKI